MLGVATPGIAPMGPDSAKPAPGPAPNRTMMGVALPGIAPLRAGEAPPASPPSAHRGRYGTPAIEPLPIVPQPEPLRDIPAPLPPRIVRRRGIPLVAVALVTGAIVLVGGVGIALLWRGAPPMAAQPRVSPDGKDILHLTCDPRSCKDGTNVELDGSSSTFAHGESDLPLVRPLHVGDNELAVHVDRPGMGRDEVLKLSVPVAYRVRADVTTMSAPHPVITIHVEAVPGSEVRMADKPLPLDASGVGLYAVDETAATDGPADESRVVSEEVSYVVVPPAGLPQRGTVSARVAVAPLRVDAPGARALLDDSTVMVAGRAAKGATVSVDGAPVAVGADGAFETSVAFAELGERTIEVRGATSVLTPRTVRIAVKRVASLADEARAFERQKTIGYDSAMSDLAASTGQPIVVEGEVIESRGSGHRTLMLVDDKRGCAKGPCLARVIVGRDLSVTRGAMLRAYGRVARAFATPAGQTVPEIEADFVLQSKR